MTSHKKLDPEKVTMTKSKSELGIDQEKSTTNTEDAHPTHYGRGGHAKAVTERDGGPALNTSAQQVGSPAKVPEPIPACLTHCWHHGGVVYTSLPPQWDEKCCECGKTERRYGKLPSGEGHGPFWSGGL